MIKIEDICFLFPGQGCQKINMGVELSKISKTAKTVYETASEVFGDDILKLCEDEKTLQNTEVAQIAIVMVSLMAFSLITEKNIHPKFIVGHSLGQYSSLFASGAVNLKDTFTLVKKRAKAMKLCCDEKDGAMCAIIGSQKEQIESELKKIKGYVIAANYNSPSQIVISGEKEAVKKAANALNKFAKKTIMLKTAGAFHTKLMAPAAEYFKKEIENIEFKVPKIKIYSNVTANIVDNPNEIKKLLIDHMTSPVLFWQSIENLNKKGIKTFVELGPKKTLTTLIKKTILDAKTFNVEDKKSLEETIFALSK